MSSDASDRESVIKLISLVKLECNDRAISALMRRRNNLKKNEEEKILNLSDLILTTTKKEEKILNVTEKSFIDEVVTEDEIDDEENVIDDEFEASAVSAGSFCTHGWLFVVLISILVM